MEEFVKRWFRLSLSVLFLAIALFTFAIVADLVFNLGFGFEVRDLKMAGISGLAWIGIYVGSRIVDHSLDSFFERR